MDNYTDRLNRFKNLNIFIIDCNQAILFPDNIDKINMQTRVKLLKQKKTDYQHYSCLFIDSDRYNMNY